MDDALDRPWCLILDIELCVVGALVAMSMLFLVVMGWSAMAVLGFLAAYLGGSSADGTSG